MKLALQPMTNKLAIIIIQNLMANALSDTALQS